jgi:hypothetical protein
VVDYHSGYPYSRVDVIQNYVGQPDSRRFPNFFSLDARVYREFHLPIFGSRIKAFRIGFYVNNITNHSNPRDVFDNVTSPHFGQFVGFQHRVEGMVIDVLD